MRVAVVGGGAVGLTAAAALADRGATVTLFERDALGSGATGRAAGIVYAASADPVDARVATRALERFRTLDDRGKIAFADRPYVWLARDGDDETATAIPRQVRRMQSHGLDVERLDPDELAARFPGLRTDDVRVAALAHDAGVVDPDAYVTATAERARQAGATLETGVDVTVGSDGTVSTPDRTETVDAVLVAAGAHTKRLLEAAGVSVPVAPYRAQVAVTEPTSAAPPTCYDATGEYYLRRYGDGLLVGDGTEPVDDVDGWDPTGDDAFEATARDHVRQSVGERPAIAESWAGLCTATPDGDPLIGAVADSLFVATGWEGHGFMRAPALGETVAARILGGDGIERFAPARFDGGESVTLPEADVGGEDTTEQP